MGVTILSSVFCLSHPVFSLSPSFLPSRKPSLTQSTMFEKLAIFFFITCIMLTQGMMQGQGAAPNQVQCWRECYFLCQCGHDVRLRGNLVNGMITCPNNECRVKSRPGGRIFSSLVYDFFSGALNNGQRQELFSSRFPKVRMNLARLAVDY